MRLLSHQPEAHMRSDILNGFVYLSCFLENEIGAAAFHLETR